jgi:hypothetical protein
VAGIERAACHQIPANHHQRFGDGGGTSGSYDFTFEEVGSKILA